MGSKIYKFEGQEFRVVEMGCSLEVRPVKKQESEVRGSVVPSSNYRFPFIGQLLDADGKHISSQLSQTVEEALDIACGFVLAYRQPNKEDVCKEITSFYDRLSTSQ